MQAVFYGLGADGTVSANKNSIKIIGEETESFAQGYFVYDSKKAGSRTVSHLRFGPQPIRAPYLIRSADFVACHQFDFIEEFDVLHLAKPGLLSCSTVRTSRTMFGIGCLAAFNRASSISSLSSM